MDVWARGVSRRAEPAVGHRGRRPRLPLRLGLRWLTLGRPPAAAAAGLDPRWGARPCSSQGLDAVEPDCSRAGTKLVAKGRRETPAPRPSGPSGPCPCLPPVRRDPVCGAAMPHKSRHCLTPGNSLRQPTPRIPCNIGLALRLLRCRQMTSGEGEIRDRGGRAVRKDLQTSSHWCRGAGNRLAWA
jgi:hypothetical protein